LGFVISDEMVSETKYPWADIDVFLDCRPKWREWFTFHILNRITDLFLQQILTGREWYRSISGDQE
jgi:hypothetical protein